MVEQFQHMPGANLQRVPGADLQQGPGTDFQRALHDDFQRALNREGHYLDPVIKYGDQLTAVLDSYVGTTRSLLMAIDDTLLFEIPHDPMAHDPYAQSEEEQHSGWNIAHLVLHVTASAEEGAAVSSLLARGIPIGGRLRYEPCWREVTTSAAVLDRLEECWRICRAYLETWPTKPHLETLQFMPEHLSWMQINAPAAFLWGFMHWHEHMAQFHNVIAQLQAAIRSKTK